MGPQDLRPQTIASLIFCRALVDGPIRVASFLTSCPDASKAAHGEDQVIPDDSIEAMLPVKTLIEGCDDC
jgi:hypothetical protein